MQKLELLRQHKYPIIIASILVALAFLWSFMSSYSGKVTDSAWDGVAARNFTSGTGTVENPYVISNAGEFAYLKEVLEGDDATQYSDKNYIITAGFNYGGFEISINSSIPFTGTIDGQGNLIYNATIYNNIFNELDGATIKNINFSDITYELRNETGAILAGNITDSTVNLITFSGEVNVYGEYSFGGFVYNSSGNSYNKILLNYDIATPGTENYKFAYSLSEDNGTNILVKSDDYQNTMEETDMVIGEFTSINTVDLSNFADSNYQVIVSNNKIIIKNLNEPEEEEEPLDDGSKAPSRGPSKAPTRGVVGSDTITEHASGASGNTFYINDLVADKNYMRGLNFAEIRNTSIPSGISTGYYDDSNLVKVEIIYDGADINNSSLVGALSPLNSENTNKFIYFKYYALERNSNGSLATNSEGNNYIKIELIDNPYSKRPYTTSGNTTTEYGFNGWVCNQNVDTTANLCANSKFSIRKSDYTRYLEVPVNGGSEIIIHLNVSWYKANVATSSYYYFSDDFEEYSMQPTFYTQRENVTHYGRAFWRQNYTTMQFSRTYVRGDDANGYMPARTWYKTDPSSTTYRYNSRETRCSRNATCYVYTANNSGIAADTEYTGGSVTFVPNFTSNGTNYESTISGFNWTYMYIQDDPNGPYTHTGQEDVPYSYLPTGMNVHGFYYQVNNPTSAMIDTGEYYDEDGVLCTSAGSCTTAYKLIQYNDSYTNTNGNSIATTETLNSKIVDAGKYYYLVTRDMNIFRYTYTGSSGNNNNSNGLSLDYLSGISQPFTVTGVAVNGTTATGILSSYSSNLTAGGDIVIENIRIYGPGNAGTNNTALGNNTRSSYSFYARGHNLKLGRNLVSSRNSSYLVGYSIMGGTNNAGPSGTFKVIVESGFYYAYHSGAMSGSTNYTLNETTILGNDYDRINATHTKLRLNIGIDGYAGGHHTAGSDSLFASYNIVKSGRFGYNSDGSFNTDSTSGMYIGGRSSTCVNSLTGAKIEGGQINTVVGGYGYNGSTDTNSTYIGMSGGTVRSIYGGAGHSTTKGNRIINVTGGTVSYSVLGGSDSYNSGYTDDGILQGSTLVYVGGNVTVGGGANTLYGVEAGSVFGAGGGDTSSTQKGTAYNSHVIINGGTINTSVYGGGNYGSTGTQYSGTSNTVIDIYAGTIGSVYGGSKSAGFSQSSYENNSKIDINMTGGTVGYIYGGSNTTGTVYGSVEIDVTGGTVNNNIYGGGKGQPTVVTNNVTVTIGNNTTGPTAISGNVYGGSALGTVNSTNKGNTTVTVNKGTITGSVFGGGEGNSNANPVVEPNVRGNITVTVNGGDITNVFGGHDQAGSYTKTDNVYLNGGTVGSVYGGGNKSSVTTTHVYLQGSTVTTLYGGSNTSGAVTTTNVEIASGSVGTIYGGNNEGGSCGTSNVNIEGTATITGPVYGGGNEVDTTTTNISLTSAGSSITAVYGGGNSASAGTTNIDHDGITVTDMYGGSNTTGTVTNSYINQNSGTVTTIYGGNNAGGNTLTSHVNMDGGTVTTIYGGGNQANGDTSIIEMTAGTVTTIFGGGNSAGLDESNVTVTGGTVTDIYGGSNTTGKVDETNVSYDNSTGTPSNIYGGGNRAEVGDTNVTFDSGTVTNIFGGGKLAQATGDTMVDINGGTVNTVFGGGDQGVVTGSSNVYITDATIQGNAYAAGNGSTAVVNGDATITIDGNTTVGSANTTAPNAGCVFGGGNQANTGTSTNNNSTSTVNILGGTFYGNVYGGAKFAVIYGDTVVNIGQSAYTSQTLEKDDIDIKGHIFGGGEANSSGSSDIYDWSFISVTNGVSINIDGDTYTNFNIDGSFYGGGNASTASGDSYLVIRNYGTVGANDPERNISIQRVTYVTIENSSILLSGAIDRANEYDREKFAISRVERLKIKDNSEIYFVSGCNLLEEFVSVDENDQKATVTINETTHTITNRNVDNRIYIYEGKNVNISHDQQTEDCGDVSGMTFFGLFNFDGDAVNTGIYNGSYDAGDTLPATGLFAKGSYVLGKHMTSHNIKVDGFYTNHRNSTSFSNEIIYVNPTPADSPFYKWFVGQNAISYTVNLVASKYSTMGAVERPFYDFSAPNTSFEVLTLDSSGLTEGISLVDRAAIPRVAASSADANSIFGLSMEASNSGWLTTGKTSYYTTSPTIRGVRHYEGENSTVAPTMLFYLYHSKNITEELDLGTVSITIQAETKLSAIASEISLLVINVNMSTALFNTNEYEGAMTPGDKYELFMSTSTNISSKSKYSAYYALYGANQNLYQTGYHRVLTSTFVFPENTKVTMLDFVNGVPEYYYHVMTANDVATATADYQANNNEICSYPLSMFTTMGSVNSSNNYNDAAKNLLYYDGTDSSEEFIFIVDFSDANIDSDKLNQKLLIEMRNSQEEDMISVLGSQHANLTYNVYTNKDSQIDINVDTSLNPLYIGYNDVFDVTINYQNSNLSGVSIIDTQYFDSKMGVQIYITNADGHVVSGTDLTGTYFLMDEQRYYPDISGYTHIKLTDKVGNTEKWIVFNTENSGLATGTYTFNFEAFASPDGIYYSSGTPDYYHENINIINSTYGLNPTINDNSVIYSSSNDKTFDLTIEYTSLLTSPNIRLQMYRRKYDEIYDTDYQTYDLQDFLISNLDQSTSNQYEYIIDNNPIRTRNYTFPVNSNLTTGTYRLVFRLYDGDTMIGEIYRYIIVK